MQTFIRNLVVISATAGAVSIAHAELPDPRMRIEASRTVLVVTDPQNDLLSP